MNYYMKRVYHNKTNFYNMIENMFLLHVGFCCVTLNISVFITFYTLRLGQLLYIHVFIKLFTVMIV